MFRYRRFFQRLNLILFLSLMFYYVNFSSSKTNVRTLKSVEYCRRNKSNDNDESFYSNLLYISKLNILYCEIPKAASTNLRRVIYGHLNEFNSLETLDRKNIWIDYQSFFKQFYITKKYQDLWKDKKLFKFIIVRHPFRRIYSVYHDKFASDHFDDTLSGWKQLEEDILLQMNANLTLLAIRRNDIRLDFRTFLLYIIDSIRNKRTINSHWEQIVKRCGLCYIDYDWIGKTENFSVDGNFLIKKLNENANKIHLEFPSKDVDKKNEITNQLPLSDLALNELFRNTIRNDNDFRVLIEYYRPDFQILNYTIPHL